jgi:hypothetical protein
MLIRVFILLAFCFPTLSQATESNYYSARPDLRKCMSPLCGGVFVQQVNKTYTLCPDNVRRKECYVADIDWSALQLSEEQVNAAQALATSGRAILRGQLAEKQFGTIGVLGELTVSEAWEAATDTPANGAFYRVHLNGVKCFAAPCPAMAEEKLNTNFQRNIVDVDLSKVGASELKLNAASENLPTGILAAGNHKRVTGPAGKSVSLLASQFYLPFTADSAKQCYIGGCSGQLCGDKPGNLISTCEYRPEYACYRTAACERQTSGNCGWSPSKELTDCLNNAGILSGGISLQ